MSAARQAKLFCRYRDNGHPYLIYRPVKEEQLSDRPTICLYHDVMNDRDIEQLKSLALPKVSREEEGRERSIDAFSPSSSCNGPSFEIPRRTRSNRRIIESVKAPGCGTKTRRSSLECRD